MKDIRAYLFLALVAYLMTSCTLVRPSADYEYEFTAADGSHCKLWVVSDREIQDGVEVSIGPDCIATIKTGTLTTDKQVSEAVGRIIQMWPGVPR